MLILIFSLLLCCVRNTHKKNEKTSSPWLNQQSHPQCISRTFDKCTLAPFVNSSSSKYTSKVASSSSLNVALIHLLLLFAWPHPVQSRLNKAIVYIARWTVECRHVWCSWTSGWNLCLFHPEIGNRVHNHDVRPCESLILLHKTPIINGRLVFSPPRPHEWMHMWIPRREGANATELFQLMFMTDKV